jgi:small-conductance mechanosensitive channel|mmetsp:Transcript_5914/g.21572  ORF Transcript_5914/g.21572 Transcript_5914/m.21572 type:complete len:104 (+) Transcript_5914:490-801(+)
MADDAARDGVAAGGDAGRKESSKEKRANRLEELNVLRVELDTKELELREAAQELLRREQTTAVLTEELELSRRLNDVLSAELNRVREEGKLSVGLCAQGLGLP